MFPAATAATAAAFMAWAVRGRSSSVFGPSVWHGPRDRRVLALTFDDGPSESTPAVLDILARQNVPATFFQIGANAGRLPPVAREVAAAGHEIGNHSHTHPLLCFRSARFMEADLVRAQKTIEDISGASPKWFRPPFGARWFGLGGVQRRLHLDAVMWSVIGYDWSRQADFIARRVTGRVSNGAIVCLHDGRELRVKPDIAETVEAVRRLVPMLLDQGYRFETVSRLLCPTN